MPPTAVPSIDTCFDCGMRAMRILHPYIGPSNAQVDAPACSRVDITIDFGSLIDCIDHNSHRVAASKAVGPGSDPR